MILSKVRTDHSHLELCGQAVLALKQPAHCTRRYVVDIAGTGSAVHLDQVAPRLLDLELLAGLMSLA